MEVREGAWLLGLVDLYPARRAKSVSNKGGHRKMLLGSEMLADYTYSPIPDSRLTHSCAAKTRYVHLLSIALPSFDGMQATSALPQFLPMVFVPGIDRNRARLPDFF
jgi:hypothetical protein